VEVVAARVGLSLEYKYNLIEAKGKRADKLKSQSVNNDPWSQKSSPRKESTNKFANERMNSADSQLS